MTELVVYVANCIIGGEKFSVYPNGMQTRDHISLNLGNQVVTLRQCPEFIRTRTRSWGKGQSIAVSSLHFPTAKKEDIPSLLQISDQVCELLSFATESFVHRYDYNFPTAFTNRPKQFLTGTVETFRPPFDQLDGGKIRHFIEICFPTYSQIRDSRSLTSVFGYLYHAGKTGVAFEIRLASLFILLENLKYTYSHQQQYPFIRGYFRQPAATNDRPGNKLTFEVLLTEMFAAVQMEPNMKLIIDLRNKLIHSGLIGDSFEANFALYEKIQDIIREYMLRLLQYSGTYRCYTLNQSKTLP